MCLSVGLLAKLSFRRQDDKKEEKLDELKKKGKKKEVKQVTERISTSIVVQLTSVTLW